MDFVSKVWKVNIFLPNKLSPKRHFIKTLFLTLVAFVRYRIFAPFPRIGQLPYKEGGKPIAVSPSFPDETWISYEKIWRRVWVEN